MSDLSFLAFKLLQLPGIGHRKAFEILNPLKENVADIDNAMLAQIVLERMADRMEGVNVPAYFSKAEDLYRTSLHKGTRFVSIFDSDYPVRLLRLKYPPVVLNYTGDISFCNNFITTTLSGTRHPTAHGYTISMRLAELFASKNCVVVAGLASGCGTAAHLGCLKAGGKTIAVVGHGLSHVYPTENTLLAERIIEAGGAIVSVRSLNENRGRNSSSSEICCKVDSVILWWLLKRVRRVAYVISLLRQSNAEATCIFMILRLNMMILLLLKINH